MEKHSEKALKTIELLGATPEACKKADIKWVLETRMVPGWVKCPKCSGERSVWTKDGVETEPPASCRSTYNPEVVYGHLAKEQSFEPKPCDKCFNNYDSRHYSRHYSWQRSRGYVEGLVPAEVWVGYPQWPTGTKHGTRFSGSFHSCELCAKAVKKSNLVPVVAVDGSGTTHGFWVGQDCAKKFLPGVSIWADVPGKRKDLRTYEG